LPRRLRKFLGAIMFMALVPLWAFVAMIIAQGPVRSAATGWQMLYYVVAGMGWIFPAIVLIRWMERPDRTP
jgi:hypothetical protein